MQMHNQNKILRVFQLINLLKTEPAKSMRHISEVLNSTERTLYRYFNLLEELGFQIHRDELNRLYIRTDLIGNEVAFSRDEIIFLKKLLQSAGKNVKIKDSILSKLLVHSDIQIGTRLALNAHLGKIVDTISKGIETKRQVVLRKYHSFHSNSISDRAVEPIAFTENYQSLNGYEIASKQNKIYNIDRITSVEVTRHPFRNGKQHRVEELDAFGFARKDDEYLIELHLSMRAALLLKEEYPMTVEHIRMLESQGFYSFKAKVFDVRPVARFILGLSQEINIVQGKELIDFLDYQLKHVFTKKTLETRPTKPAARIAKKLTVPRNK
jgi:predicted DNA-binding transcriptional regulator YafY